MSEFKFAREVVPGGFFSDMNTLDISRSPDAIIQDESIARLQREMIYLSSLCALDPAAGALAMINLHNEGLGLNLDYDTFTDPSACFCQSVPIVKLMERTAQESGHSSGLTSATYFRWRRSYVPQSILDTGGRSEQHYWTDKRDRLRGFDVADIEGSERQFSDKALCLMMLSKVYSWRILLSSIEGRGERPSSLLASSALNGLYNVATRLAEEFGWGELFGDLEQILPFEEWLSLPFGSVKASIRHRVDTILDSHGITPDPWMPEDRTTSRPIEAYLTLKEDHLTLTEDYLGEAQSISREIPEKIKIY